VYCPFISDGIVSFVILPLLLLGIRSGSRLFRLVVAAARSNLLINRVSNWFLFHRRTPGPGEGEDLGIKSCVEKLTEFRAAGRELAMARTRVEGIIMPTDRLITILTKKEECGTYKKLEAADCQQSVSSFRSMSCFSK
jgi:hypothetical protein